MSGEKSSQSLRIRSPWPLVNGSDEPKATRDFARIAEAEFPRLPDGRHCSIANDRACRFQDCWGRVTTSRRHCSAPVGELAVIEPKT
jgi:hypothetical protein